MSKLSALTDVVKGLWKTPEGKKKIALAATAGLAPVALAPVGVMMAGRSMDKQAAKAQQSGFDTSMRGPVDLSTSGGVPAGGNAPTMSPADVMRQQQVQYNQLVAGGFQKDMAEDTSADIAKIVASGNLDGNYGPV